MLFTFVILFLTLGCDLAYGQGEEGNEKEEVTVTLNFSEKGAFGLKNNNANNNQSVLTDITFKVQDLSVSLLGMICYHEGENTYLRLDKWYNNPGQINISVPNSALINSVTLGTNDYKIANLNANYRGREKTIDVDANKTATVSTINSDNISFIEEGGKSGDKSFITSITITYTRPKLDATLDEKAFDAECTIKGIVGENKTLALNRTFNPSQLYTMCLPFDLSKDMITEIFGNETKVYSYDGYQNGELSFSAVKEGVLNAGMPFLMRSEYYVEQPTFAGVTVESTPHRL